MRKTFVLAALIALKAWPVVAEPVGEFSEHADVGDVSTPGSATFADGAYHLTSSGANIWGSVDAFHYAWTQRSGDLHIAADNHPSYPPVVLGHEFVGAIAALGEGVTGWEPGETKTVRLVRMGETSVGEGET